MCDLKQQEKKMRKIKKNLDIDVEVKFIPFPCEDARQEAYRTHARLWLRARERELKSKERIFSRIGSKKSVNQKHKIPALTNPTL